MDFSAIASIQQTRQQLENRRQQQAENLLKTAFETMGKAFNSPGPQKRRLLQSALESFAGALQQQRSNPEIYIGLAYLLISLQEFAQAYNYLQEGQRLAPGHPDILQMQTYLKQRTERIQSRPPSAVPEVALPESELDYDALYDEVESQLQTVLAGLRREPLPAQPSLALIQASGLNQMYQQGQQLSVSLQRDLRVLHQEFDTAPLERQMAQLNQWLKSCQRLLAGAQTLKKLSDELQAFRREIQEQTQRFTQTGTVPPVDDLLDHCDALADQLDEYDRLGYELKELLLSYEALVEELETLQNLIDDQTV